MSIFTKIGDLQSYVSKSLSERWEQGEYVPIATEVEAVKVLGLGAIFLTLGGLTKANDYFTGTKSWDWIFDADANLGIGKELLQYSVPRVACCLLAAYGAYQISQPNNEACFLWANF